MSPINPRIFGPDNDSDWQRRRREKTEKRRAAFDRIAEEAVTLLNLTGQEKTWHIDADLLSGIVMDRTIQELCNAIVSAQAKANGEDDIVGYPPSQARRAVEQGFEFDLVNTGDGYNLILKAKGTFRFSKD